MWARCAATINRGAQRCPKSVRRRAHHIADPRETDKVGTELVRSLLYSPLHPCAHAHPSSGYHAPEADIKERANVSPRVLGHVSRFNPNKSGFTMLGDWKGEGNLLPEVEWSECRACAVCPS